MTLTDSKYSFICSLRLLIKEGDKLKVNYSKLARNLELDRHTVKNYITNPLLERKKRVYMSIYDINTTTLLNQL